MSVSRLWGLSPLRTGTAGPCIIAEAAGSPAAQDCQLSSAGATDPPPLCNSSRRIYRVLGYRCSRVAHASLQTGTPLPPRRRCGGSGPRLGIARQGSKPRYSQPRSLPGPLGTVLRAEALLAIP